MAGGRRHYDPPVSSRAGALRESDTMASDLARWSNEGGNGRGAKSSQRK